MIALLKRDHFDEDVVPTANRYVVEIVRSGQWSCIAWTDRESAAIRFAVMRSYCGDFVRVVAPSGNVVGCFEPSGPVRK